MKSLKDEIIDLQKKYLMPCVDVWHEIVFIKGEGATLEDTEGKKYLDCFAGVSVVNAGHRHPKIVKAVKDQLDKITHLSTLYYTEPMPRLAKMLSDIAPMDRGNAKKTFFCNSGTEANEHAVTLAKKYTKKNEIIGLQCGFYGRGGLTMSLSGLGAWREGLGPFMPGVLHAPAYYCYRCPLGHREGPPGCDYACAHYIEYMLKTETAQRVAAFVAEPILGIGGCVPAPQDYFKVVKEILDRHSILLVVDEVQTGFGRTGKMFGIEHYGVEPDIVTVAKGLGSGIPIGAMIARAAVADAYPGPHFSTFGGNPLSCAAAIANIDVILEERLTENAERVGRRILKRLIELQDSSRLVDDAEGKGLMIGAEIVEDKVKRTPAKDEVLVSIMNEAADRGVLIGRGGLFYNRIRIQPPLILTEKQADLAMDAVDEAIRATEKKM
ncbi:MAG: aspartate aminotransferase family protein [Candidatus Bathyarchaeia archaeon]